MEIYFSTDVETDGPIPGRHSMLSFGSAAFTAEGEMLGTYSANLELLPEATPNPDTMQWWSTQPEAWAACRENLQAPNVAMGEFVAWIESFKKRPVFVGYPAGFDFLFVYWYLIAFTGHSPFSHSALDIKTLAMAVLGTEYRNTVKKTMPRRWFPEHKHTHVAIDDAIEQGHLFVNILKEARAMSKT